MGLIGSHSSVRSQCPRVGVLKVRSGNKIRKVFRLQVDGILGKNSLTVSSRRILNTDRRIGLRRLGLQLRRQRLQRNTPNHNIINPHRTRIVGRPVREPEIEQTPVRIRDNNLRLKLHPLISHRHIRRKQPDIGVSAVRQAAVPTYQPETRTNTAVLHITARPLSPQLHVDDIAGSGAEIAARIRRILILGNILSADRS